MWIFFGQIMKKIGLIFTPTFGHTDGTLPAKRVLSLES